MVEPINLDVGKSYIVTFYGVYYSYGVFPQADLIYNVKIRNEGWRSDSTPFGYYCPTNFSTAGSPTLYGIDILIGEPITESVITEYKVQKDTLTDIADEVKRITGATYTLSTAAIIDGLETVVLQEKSITPTAAVQEVVPDTGYYGFSKVIVDAVEAKAEITITDDGNGNVSITTTSPISFVDDGSGNVSLEEEQA